MYILTPERLNQAGLVLGFLGAILLSCAAKVGVVSRDGTVIFDGMDPMESSEVNRKRVRRSHWRNRWFTPIGWGLVAISFAAQYLATLG
jgi:hypothetical protein